MPKRIRTTKAMRQFYEIHVNELYEMAGKRTKSDRRHFDMWRECNMCNAARGDDGMINCYKCPLGRDRIFDMGCVDARSINLRMSGKTEAQATATYGIATPKSIIKHADWICERIEEFTDCEMERV